MAMALHCYAFSCPHVCVQMFILYVKHTQFIYMGMFRNGVKSSLSPPQHTHTHTHTYTHTHTLLYLVNLESGDTHHYQIDDEGNSGYDSELKEKRTSSKNESHDVEIVELLAIT